MVTDSCCLIAGAFLYFKSFNYIDWWTIWNWKLDPYKCLLPLNENEIIIITGDGHASIPNFQALIHYEKAGFFERCVYRIENGETLWCYIRSKNKKIILAYKVTHDWRKVCLLKDCSNTPGHLAFEYLGQILPCTLLKYNVLFFHGVLIEYQGWGIIISAPSGTGKTTHARLWRDEKHALILNGDRAVCRKIEGKWTGFGLPWSGTSGEQINRSVPIKAVVVLERKEVNRAFPISGEEALAGVLSNLQCPAWDAQLTGKAMDLLDDFLRHVPVIRLQCRPDKEAVEVLEKALLNL